MDSQKELQVQKKRELEKTDETTVPARYFQPNTDIFEDQDKLTVVMEMPGVDRSNVDVNIEKNVLQIEGRIDFSSYKELQPVYTEYNVGHYRRSFTLSNKIDQDKISAELSDGVLTVTLPKAAEAKPRTIKIS